MKKVIITFAVFTYFGFSCSIYAETISFQPKYIGVSSMMGDTATLESTGMLIFDLSEKQVNASDWGVDSTVKETVVETLKKMNIKTELILFPKEEKQQIIDSLRGAKYFNKIERNEQLSSLVSFATSKGMDGLLIIIPSPFQYPNSKLVLEGYGVLYIPDNYYPNKPSGSYFFATAYLVDVANHGIFKLSSVSAGAKLGVEKVLTEEDKRKIKEEFDRKYADSEEEDLDWKLQDAMKLPHHTMDTFKEISDSDRQQIVSNLRGVLKQNLGMIIPKLFEKKIVSSWGDE